MKSYRKFLCLIMVLLPFMSAYSVKVKVTKDTGNFTSEHVKNYNVSTVGELKKRIYSDFFQGVIPDLHVFSNDSELEDDNQKLTGEITATFLSQPFISIVDSRGSNEVIFTGFHHNTNVVGDVSKKYAEIFGLKNEDVELSLGGKRLNKTHNLRGSGIEPGSTVRLKSSVDVTEARKKRVDDGHVILSSHHNRENENISVKTPSLSVLMKSTDTVRNLKEKYASEIGSFFSADDIQISFEDTVLDDDTKTLVECGIQDGSLITYEFVIKEGDSSQGPRPYLVPALVAGTLVSAGLVYLAHKSGFFKKGDSIEGLS